MLNKNIFTAAALILLGTSIQVKAQDITVAGTVKDVYGNPLPGVIVSANHKDLYITSRHLSRHPHRRMSSLRMTPTILPRPSTSD